MPEPTMDTQNMLEIHYKEEHAPTATTPGCRYCADDFVGCFTQPMILAALARFSWHHFDLSDKEILSLFRASMKEVLDKGLHKY